MRIAVALFGEEISPRFDCCGALAFTDSEESLETAEVIRFKSPDSERRLGLLLERSCQVLLCGGIRRCDWFRLQTQGIRVISELQGQASDRFKDYREGRLQPEASPNNPDFGCQHGRLRRRKGS